MYFSALLALLIWVAFSPPCRLLLAVTVLHLALKALPPHFDNISYDVIY